MMRRILIAVVALALFGGTDAAAAGFPNTFTFTARLADNGVPVDGPVTLGLALYDAGSGGTQLWAETQAAQADKGLIQVAMGGASPLTLATFDGRDLWLEVSVNGTAMSPRSQIRAVPYAMRAAVCDGADWNGLTNVPTGFADGVDNDSGGTITGVTAGTGLSGGGTSGTVSLAVQFGGNGAATSAARSDHNHDTRYVRGIGLLEHGRVSCVSGCQNRVQTFSPAFSGTPTVELTAESAGSNVYCQVLTVSTSSFSYTCPGNASYLHWLAIY